VTLREAFTAGLFPTLDAARKAAQRHLEPVGERGNANLYDLEALAALRSPRVKAGR
jgi:hypothetical protein